VPLGIVYNKTQVGGVWFAFLFPLSTATGLVSLTNKGDIPSYDGNNPLVVPVGPITGYVLTVNPGAPTGFAWEELPGGSTIAPGILQLGTTAGTACEGNDVRLGAGGRPYSGRMVSVTRNANTSSRSKDGGLTWILGANPPTGGWYGVVWDPVHSVFVTLSNGATNPGGSQYSVDAGATWTTGGQLSATIQTWYRLFYDPAHASIVAVPRLQTTGAVRSTDGGVSWVVSASTFPSVGFTYGCYDPDHQRVVYVSETSTDTLYTADGGVTWLPGGALPGGLQTSISYDPVHHRLVSLPVSPNTQSAYSTDGGTTWSAGGSVPITGGTWFGNCYDPVHRVIIGVNDVTTQTIYSADGGLTWNNGGTLAAPAAVRTMVWDPVSALIYFVYNGNTVAYYSENGGATWTSVTSPVTFGPGLAVAYP
jgi:hypothetical protein